MEILNRKYITLLEPVQDPGTGKKLDSKAAMAIC